MTSCYFSLTCVALVWVSAEPPRFPSIVSFQAVVMNPHHPATSETPNGVVLHTTLPCDKNGPSHGLLSL